MSAAQVDVLTECADYAAAQVECFRAAKASARKSYGSFKAIIRYSDGRTEICAQRRELRNKVWIDGKPDPKTAYIKNYRGLVFGTSAEAKKYAENCISAMIERAQKRLDGYRARLGGAA